MSYTTNPITNRLKINKGWKIPTLPNHSWDYTSQMLLWFQLYLLLKVYLSWHSIQLLTCEIRNHEKSQKILYLAVTKTFKKKKHIYKLKGKSKSLLRKLKISLHKTENKNQRFLLYQNVNLLKRMILSMFTTFHTQSLSKTWISKNRIFSWLNLAKTIAHLRKKNKFKDQLYHAKKNLILFSSNIRSFKEKKTGIKILNKKSTNKTQVLRTEDQVNFVQQKLWLKKQKKIVSLLTKLQKEVLFLVKNLSLLNILNDEKNVRQLQTLIQILTEKLNEKKQLLTKVKTLYHFWVHMDCELQIQAKETFFENQLQKTKKRVHIKLIWGYLKKTWTFLKKQTSFSENNPQFFWQWQTLFLQNTFKYQFLVKHHFQLHNLLLYLYVFYGPNLSKILFHPQENNSIQQAFRGLLFTTSVVNNPSLVNLNQTLKNNCVLNSAQSLSLQNTSEVTRGSPLLLKMLWKKKTLSLPEIKIFNRKKNLFTRQLTRWLKFKQKKQVLLKKKRKKKIKAQKINPISKNAFLLKKKFEYRLFAKDIYRKNLKTLTKLKFKYFLQDFLQRFFLIQLSVKVIWPLSEFKNLKFYRMVFPSFHKRNRKKRVTQIHFNKRNNRFKWHYIYIGSPTNHVQSISNLKKRTQQKVLFEKIKAKLQLKSFTFNEKFSKQNSFASLQSTVTLQQTKSTNIVPHLWKRKPIRKTTYLKNKLKTVEFQRQKELNFASKSSLMPNLMNTLTLFTKYLDPQNLADLLAKLLGKTRKHTQTLKFIEALLNVWHFKRGIGYRIAIVGRTNGATKTQTMYLKKLNRNYSRQTFSKNVNFALAQVRTRSGTLGIKIWVYF